MQIRHELVHQKLCSFYEDFEKDAKEGHALEEELIHLRCYMSDTVQKFLQVQNNKIAIQIHSTYKKISQLFYQIFADAKSRETPGRLILSTEDSWRCNIKRKDIQILLNMYCFNACIPLFLRSEPFFFLFFSFFPTQVKSNTVLI